MDITTDLCEIFVKRTGNSNISLAYVLAHNIRYQWMAQCDPTFAPPQGGHRGVAPKGIRCRGHPNVTKGMLQHWC